MNYATLTTQLALTLGTNATGANYLAILPQIILDAEQRCYRECDFLSTRASTTLNLVASTRSYTLPTLTIGSTSGVKFLVVQSISAITPASTAPDAGTRNPVHRASRDFLDFVWPTSNTAKGLPQWFAFLDDQTVRFAPTPDAAYQAEIVGTYRPPTMSGTVTTTYLGDTYPDLFFAACMVFGAGYQKNFGAQADDPKMAMTWEQTFQLRKQSAVPEAFRQKGEGEAWTPYQPSPLASPPRT